MWHESIQLQNRDERKKLIEQEYKNEPVSGTTPALQVYRIQRITTI